MALQSNPPLAMTEIKAELGSASNSLLAYGQQVGFSTPFAMSDFLGYAAFTPSLYYWKGDGVNDTMRITGQATFGSTTNDWSWSAWYRIDETAAATQWLGSISQASQNGSNQIFLQYESGSNTLNLRFRHAGSFHQKKCDLVTNSSATGITSGYWTASNRGNVNADGFCMLTFTYDASDRNAATGLKIYWNGNLLGTHELVSSVGSPSHWNFGSMAIADLVSTVPYNVNLFNGGVDNVSIHHKILSQSEITALYNGGVPIKCSDAGVTSNLVGEYLLESSSDNTSGTYPDVQNLNGGIFTAY